MFSYILPISLKAFFAKSYSGVRYPQDSFSGPSFPSSFDRVGSVAPSSLRK